MKHSSPNLKLQIAHITGNDRYAGTGKNSTDKFSGFNLKLFCTTPKSRGTIHLKSDKYYDFPEIVSNYFDHEDDMTATLNGFKMLRNIASMKSMKKIIIEETLPGPSCIDDNMFIEFIKNSGQTCWHPVGTCKMGSDKMAVVDNNLNVIGIDSLRVADASVMPHLVSSNTNIPAIIIGEKCADLILNSF